MHPICSRWIIIPCVFLPFKLHILIITLHIGSIFVETWLLFCCLFINWWVNRHFLLVHLSSLKESTTDRLKIYFRYHVGQSTMQLTCCGTTRNFRKIRLQSSLLNCDYTLQVLQHVSTRLYQRLHCNDVYVCFYYPNNTQVQTATFQTNGLRSVRLYVHNT